MTFSIVARHPKTGAFGVAVSTAGPLVGSLVPHLRTAVGAVATQALTNPYLALDCLDYLKGLQASAALELALRNDPQPQKRQLIVVDAQGTTAGWSGGDCEPFADHIAEPDVAVAGNFLAGRQVLDAMLAAFHRDLPFDMKLLEALSAGERAGGDVRGKGSAALKIVSGESYPCVDIRIDQSGTPVEDLIQCHSQTRDDYRKFLELLPKRGERLDGSRGSSSML